jgi:hypothetical protein
MNNNLALLAALSLAAAALVGCSSGETEAETDRATHVENHQDLTQALNNHEFYESIDAEPTPSVVPEPAGPDINGVEFENEWTEKQLRDFMIYQGANSLDGFSKGSPERNILAVTEPEDGIVRFEVAALDYEADGWDIEGLAVNYMSFTGCAADGVEAVIVETAGGGDSVTRDGCYG